MAQVETDEERKAARCSDFARRVTHWRKAAGLRQVGLAAASGLSESMISRIETAQAECSQAAEQAIAEACGVTMSTFWSELPPLSIDTVEQKAG